MIRRPRAAVALALAAAFLAAGCSGPRVPATPDPGPAHTAVTPRQAVAALDAVDAALVRAVQARDVARLDGRAVGPARDAFATAITVQAKLGRATGVPPAPGTPRLMLTQAGPWPRWFAAAGSSPASATPLLEVLFSADARSPYGLWAQLNLLPGAVLPEVASATIGSPVLGPDAAGLAATPAETLTRYADLLTRGDASAYVRQFGADRYRRELTDQLGADRQAFSQRGVGQVLAAHTVAAGAPMAIPTQDGGALVIGRVDERYTAAVTQAGGSIRLDDALAALVGRATLAHGLDRRSVEVFAFHVPRAGTADTITLLAASRSEVAATGT